MKEGREGDEGWMEESRENKWKGSGKIYGVPVTGNLWLVCLGIHFTLQSIGGGGILC